MQGRRKRPATQEAAVDPAAEDELVCWPSMRLAIGLDMQDTAGLLQPAVMLGNDRADSVKRMRSLVRLQYMICLAQTFSVQSPQAQALRQPSAVSRDDCHERGSCMRAGDVTLFLVLRRLCVCGTSAPDLPDCHILSHHPGSEGPEAGIISAPSDEVPLPVHTLCAHHAIHESSRAPAQHCDLGLKDCLKEKL